MTRLEGSSEHFSATDGNGYRGYQNHTVNGETCMNWLKQSPHEHTKTVDNYPNFGLGDHNYCRNPDGKAGIWCYTTNPESRWQPCDPLPAISNWITDNSNAIDENREQIVMNNSKSATPNLFATMKNFSVQVDNIIEYFVDPINGKADNNGRTYTSPIPSIQIAYNLAFKDHRCNSLEIWYLDCSIIKIRLMGNDSHDFGYFNYNQKSNQICNNTQPNKNLTTSIFNKVIIESQKNSRLYKISTHKKTGKKDQNNQNFQIARRRVANGIFHFQKNDFKQKLNDYLLKLLSIKFTI